MRFLSGGEVKRFPIESGLIGQALVKKELLSISDCSNSSDFNGLIDIDTSMPVIVKPVFGLP